MTTETYSTWVQYRRNGKQRFELSNHLGNVLAIISDKGIPVCSVSNKVVYYKTEIITANDYYPFGMVMSNRTWQATSLDKYRFGFGGQEKDDEVKGNANSIAFEARIYDSRLGKWLAVDPLMKKYPKLSPYIYVNNNPIIYIDEDGRDWILYNGTTVTWYAGVYGDRTTIKKTSSNLDLIYKGTSGVSPTPTDPTDYRNSIHQNVANKGPVPEGKYSINLTLDAARIAPVNAD